MDSPPKEETTNIELPHDENKLFDADDDVATSTIADLSVPRSVNATFFSMPITPINNW